MINEIYARQYCREDISKIENYEHAARDDSQVWDCHHRGEILPCGRFSIRDLKKFGLYWHRPASELVFLTRAEHTKLHRVGRGLSEEHRQKLRQVNLGRHHSEDTKRKLREAQKKVPVEQYSKDGTFVARYPSTQEAERRTGARHDNIVVCCKGRRRSAGGYAWKYA